MLNGRGRQKGGAGMLHEAGQRHRERGSALRRRTDAVVASIRWVQRHQGAWRVLAERLGRGKGLLHAYMMPPCIKTAMCGVCKGHSHPWKLAAGNAPAKGGRACRHLLLEPWTGLRWHS